jgi:hypothetical protein
VLKRGHDIEHPPGVDINAKRAEDAAEMEKVVEEKWQLGIMN